MKQRSNALYFKNRNTVKKTLAFLLVFALMFSASALTKLGSIKVQAAATSEVTFYYYDPDCGDDSCLAITLWDKVWGKLENTGDWAFDSVYWFQKTGDNWYSTTIKYDPDTYTDNSVGFAVARLKTDASEVDWNSDILWQFSPSYNDGYYDQIFNSAFKDPAFYINNDGNREIVSYASIPGDDGSQGDVTKNDIQALLDTVPADYTTDGIYEPASVSSLQQAVSDARDHISNGDDAQNHTVYTALKNALDGLRYYDESIVVQKVAGLSDDFIKGVDVSSYITLVNSGVKFYNFEGQQVESKGFFKVFADAGVNYVRIRIWNDPKNAAGEYYGGGNNDVATAVKICEQIHEYNTAYSDDMKVLIDFHYSDFWVDPDKQKAPKAWQSMSLNEKTAALKTFTTDSLTKIAATGITIGMVQIGNETNNGICGETGIETAGAGMCAIFQAGCEAIDAYNSEKGTTILKVVHFTDPHKQDTAVYNAKTLLDNGVNYDVYATSYYPYWHQTTGELSEVLKKIAAATGKKVMVAETQEIYTNNDADGFDNQAYEGKDNIDTSAYPVSVQGQANEFRDVIAAVASAGDSGIGMFYWEPAWLPVGYAYNEDGSKNESVYANNQEIWKNYGSGWAAPSAEEFDESVKQWGYGGTNCENAALFDFNGHPLASLNVFKYVNYGTAGASETYYDSKFDITSVTARVGMSADELRALLPEKTTASTNYGNEQECTVAWDTSILQEIAADIATNAAAGNSYTAKGTVVLGTDSHTVLMQIEVIPAENRLVNGDFESGDTGWEFGSYTYAKEEPTNSKGNISCDFSTYNITEPVPYTTCVKQTVTITEPGYYSLIGFAEGNSGVGNTDLGESIRLQATDGAGKQYTANNLELQGWMIWQKASVEKIMITQQMIDEGTNTLEVAWILTLLADRWGTLDDTYLFKTEDLPDTDTPGTSAPGTSTPGTSTPGTSTPGTSTPGTSAPGTVNKPSVDTPVDPDPSVPAQITYEVVAQADGSLQVQGSDGTIVKNQLITVSDGNMYYADADGIVAVKKIVAYNDVKYFAKENGTIARNEFCTTVKGSTVYAQADGSLAVNQTITVDGKKYYAKSNCALAKNGFFTTAKGSKVYAKASGELIVNQAFQVNGLRYYAKPSAAIVRGGFYTTAKGNRIYAKASGVLVTGKVFRVDGKLYCAKASGALTKTGFYTMPSGTKVYTTASGELAVNRIFSVKGKKFYADKDGAIAANKWITAGNKKYYCCAAYKITKSVKISA